GASNEAPPFVDGIGCEGRRVVRRPDDDKSISPSHIIDPIGNRNALCITWEVVDRNVQRLPAPKSAWVLEKTDQLPLLRISLYDWLPSLRKVFFQPFDLQELPFSLW